MPIYPSRKSWWEPQGGYPKLQEEPPLHRLAASEVGAGIRPATMEAALAQGRGAPSDVTTGTKKAGMGSGQLAYLLGTLAEAVAAPNTPAARIGGAVAGMQRGKLYSELVGKLEEGETLTGADAVGLTPEEVAAAREEVSERGFRESQLDIQEGQLDVTRQLADLEGQRIEAEYGEGGLGEQKIANQKAHYQLMELEANTENTLRQRLLNYQIEQDKTEKMKLQQMTFANINRAVSKSVALAVKPYDVDPGTLDPKDEESVAVYERKQDLRSRLAARFTRIYFNRYWLAAGGEASGIINPFPPSKEKGASPPGGGVTEEDENRIPGF